jgi:plastocyanin
VWVADGTTLTASATLASPGATLEWAIGPMAGTAPITQFAAGVTPLIQPGASASIRFDELGVFYMHCHPHPWMRNNVTVVDDGRPPETVTVRFVDGDALGDYHFVPENVIVPKGSTVVYQNDGAQPHQAMLLQQDAPLQVLPLKAASGPVTITGSGWTRVVALAFDATGRTAVAEKDFYVTPTLPQPETRTWNGSYNATAPAPVPTSPADAPPASYPFSATGDGNFTLTWRSQDGVAGHAPADPAGDQSALDVSLSSKDGKTHLAQSTAPADNGTLMGRLGLGDYAVTVTPEGGALVDYTVTLTLQYDLVPPPPRQYADATTTVVMKM